MAFPKLYSYSSLTGLALLASTIVINPAYSADPPPFPTSTLPPTTPAPIPPEESYTLGGGDLVQIDIFDAPEYSGQNARYQVLIDGSLNLPLVGNISVKGLTLKQAGNLLTQKYIRYFQRPLTTVTLLAPRPLSISVTGEVNRPGSYPINLAQQAGQITALSFPTLTSALKLAGGITQAADVKKIQIRRTQSNGSNQILTVNLWQFLQSGDRSQDITLRDGDSITIPTATKIDLAESAQLSDASFAADRSQPITIAIIGEVFRPGSYVVTGNTRTGTAGVPGSVNQTFNQTIDPFPTVTRAIQIAGGIKPLADIRHIQIHRSTRSGTKQIIDVNLLKLLKDGDLYQDVILQAGDTVTIPTATQLSPAETTELASASFSPDSIRVNVVGEVKQPGTVQIPPNSTLNQAILAAGGFDLKRANTRIVELIRLNSDGTVSKQQIPINFAQGINDKTNPSLHNNDIVVIGRSGLAKFSDGLSSVLAPVNTLPVFSILNLVGL